MLSTRGFRRNVATLATVTLVCPNGHTADHRLDRLTRSFLVFPVSHQYATACTACGWEVVWPKEQATGLVAHVRALESAARQPAGQAHAPLNRYPSATSAAPQTPAPAAPPAAWYPDPSGQPLERWWDNRGWTEAVRQPASPS